jgi:hypothetical protein
VPTAPNFFLAFLVALWSVQNWARPHFYCFSFNGLAKPQYVQEKPLYACPFTPGQTHCLLGWHLSSRRSGGGVVLGVPLSEAQWSFATLPVRHGGCGAVKPEFIHKQWSLPFWVLQMETGLQLTRLPPDLDGALLKLRSTVSGDGGCLGRAVEQ